MKDYLLDLVQHTHGLGVIELVKIVGTKKSTEILAKAEDKSVIVFGTFNTAIPDFDGTFGMPNLSKLKTILSFDDYDEKAIITVSRNDDDQPQSINFETGNKDFINNYRLMSKTLVEEKVANVTFKGANWDVEFEPTIASIMRLKKQASANNEELTFTTKTENNDLKFYFGDHSTHSGNFVFQSGIKGSLTKAWRWPVKVFVNILDLPGDKVLRFSDKGAAEITVASGLSTYRYIFPAQAK